jgi:glycosyltransferase involved in cell wall biosynthesis
MNDNTIIQSVTVVIPTYNRERDIKRAVESVLSQTYRELKVIIVDDGSTDNTEQIVRSIHDTRIKYIKCETNSGPSAARNLGIQCAKGEYIAFLDSDDEWLPSKLEKQVALLRSLSDSFGICHTGAVFLKNGFNKTVFKPSPQSSGNIYKQFVLSKISFVTPSLLFRRSCIERVGLFDVNLWQAEDADLLLRTLKDNNLAVIQEPLVVCHLDTTKVMDPDKLERAQLLLLKKHEHDFQSLGRCVLRRFRSRRFWIVANNKLRAGQISSGLYYLRKAFSEYPLSSPEYAIRAILIITNLQKIIKKVLIFFSKLARLQKPD